MSIVGIIVTVIFVLLTYCSCKVASWADQDMEEKLLKKENDKNENWHKFFGVYILSKIIKLFI